MSAVPALNVRIPCQALRFCLLLALSLGCQPQPATNQSVAEAAKSTEDGQVPDGPALSSTSARKKADFNSTVTLFDGKTLDGWEQTNFGGEGEVRVEEGRLILESGYPMTGVHSTREDLPTTNYEISLEAKQTSGIDFFCGLTFPVAESHCTFIVGGWGGAVVGLSNVDGDDASRNETRKLMTFDADRWYELKLRVEPNRIQAWIDDERVVDLDTEGKKIDLRTETLLCRPLGICNFDTTSEYRNINLKQLAIAEVPETFDASAR